MNEQISINLSSDISYVNGTVNGEEASFSLTAPGEWSATVPKASDGKYVISITAYNSLGTATTYNTVMYKLDDIINPKTNWTEYDYYNADDLNRVEANIQYIAEYLNSLAYNVILEDVKTDRDMTSIEFLSGINRVERNIDAIRNSFITPPGWLNKKIWALGIGFDYKDANRLENNLKLLYEWAVIVKENLIYCGTFSCGSEWEGGLY